MSTYLVSGSHPIYMITYFLLIIGFTYFFVAITFNPEEVADDMKKYGGFIPGIRAGRPTSRVPRLRPVARHRCRARCTSASWPLIPLIALAAVGANQNFPFGGDVHPDHRRCGLETVKQIDEPTPAAQLRRAPPLIADSVLMGPPGAGQGHSGDVVARARFGIPADLDRQHLPRERVAETPLGVEAKRYMDAGDYVPDEVTNAMVRSRIAEPDAASGFLLDGYPRTVAQVDESTRCCRTTTCRSTPSWC